MSIWRKIKNRGHWLEAVFWAMYYRFPAKRLTVIGVTGTDGKTTTVNLIHHILTAAGIKTAIYSTLSSAHTTTPPPAKLQKFLATSIKNGCTHAVLEVSSHAIDQSRIWGIDFAVGVLTNIADHEHRDYHGTFAAYRETKLKFLQGCRKVVVNLDDETIKNLSNLSNLSHLTFAIKTKTADLTPEKFAFKTQLLGGFNQANCLAAIGAGRLLGVADEVIRKAVATFAAPPGRMEVVRERPCKIIVDFAHTPQAFQNVLPVIRDQVLGSRNKLIHVFGCTGDRDKSKRPIMGRIAAGYDDVIILTSEDTYSEGAEDIIRQIEEGVRGSQSARDNGQWIKDNRQENGEEGEGKRKCYYIILDRREAIKKALALARPGDVVLLTGVGHQKSLNMGGKEVPWSERGTVEELLRNKK